MTPEQFTYWLQGYVELTGEAPPSPAQWKSMREHLATVFEKVTPAVERKPIISFPETGIVSFPEPVRLC